MEEQIAAIIAPIVAEEPGPVLLCLQAVQEHFGYVPEGAAGVVADRCNVTRADVHGVLSFYSDLRKEPPAQIPVRLCAAEACQAVGARQLAADWQAACAKDPEMAALTGTDEPIFCLGNCALGPAALVDKQLVGRANVERIKAAVQVARGESS